MYISVDFFLLKGKVERGGGGMVRCSAKYAPGSGRLALLCLMHKLGASLHTTTSQLVAYKI